MKGKNFRERFMEGNLMVDHIEHGDNIVVNVEQDCTSHLQEAADMRAFHASNKFGKKKDTGFKQIGILPDVIALDIMTKFGVNAHDPDVNADKLKYLVKIIKTHYPHLLIHNIVRGGR